MLSMPVIIDLSTISVQLLRSLFGGTKYLPTQYRIAFLVADLVITAGLQLWIQNRREDVDHGCLPLGSRVRRIGGRDVLKWDQFFDRQPPPGEE
jgi:hypothetical protein